MSFEIMPGVIYSAFFPFSDLSNVKKRPVLALSEKDDNGDVCIAYNISSEAAINSFKQG